LTESILGDLEELGQEISQDIAERRRLRAHVKRTREALGEVNLEALLRLLDKKKELKSLERLYPKASGILEKARIDLDRRLDDLMVELVNKLEAYCQQESIPLRGRSPDFVIDSLLDFSLDRRTGTAKVGNSFVPNLEWRNIRAAIEEERQRIWGRPFNASDFRDELVEIHVQVLELKPNPTDWVRLEDVYQVLKEREQERNPEWRSGGRLVPYYKDEFSADLSKLWAAQASGEVRGQHVALSGIRDPRAAFKVVLPGGQTESYGHLRPERS
jgi:hypothetical protein